MEGPVSIPILIVRPPVTRKSRKSQLIVHVKAGAGPTGLLLALALLQNGVKVRIVDSRDPHARTPPWHLGACYGLQVSVGSCANSVAYLQSVGQPRTLEIFRLSGILDQIPDLPLLYKPLCEYKLPGGTEPLMIIQTTPIAASTPSVPYVGASNDVESSTVRLTLCRQTPYYVIAIE